MFLRPVRYVLSGRLGLFELESHSWRSKKKLIAFFSEKCEIFFSLLYLHFSKVADVVLKPRSGPDLGTATRLSGKAYSEMRLE